MPHQCTNCDRTFADGSKEMLSGCPECGGTKFQFRPDGFDGGSGSDATDAAPSGGPSPAEPPPDPTDRPGDSMTRTVGNAAATVRDLVGGSAGPDATQARPPGDGDGADGTPSTAATGSTDDDIIVADEEPLDEDSAQAEARTELADPEEMPGSEGFDPAGSGDRSDSAEPPVETADSTEDAADPTADGQTDSAGDGREVADEPDTERTDRPDLSELRKELNDQFESIRVVEPGQYELNLMELYDREEYIIALQEDGRYSIQVPETWRQADA